MEQEPKLSRPDQFWLENYEYERRMLKQRDRDEENIKVILEKLECLAKSQRDYLRYAQLKGWFKMSGPQEEQEHALHNALTTVISRAINYEIADAEKLAFDILQDVNAHEDARKIAEVLGLKLKPYEME